MSSVQQFKRARRAAVPLAAIESADPAATVRELVTGLKDGNPVVLWDCIRGHKTVQVQDGKLTNETGYDEQTAGNPTVFLMETAPSVDEKTVVFMFGMDEWLSESSVRQGVWNLRDSYKTEGQMLVLIGAGIQLPGSLSNDVIMIEEEFPSDEMLAVLAKDLDKDASEGIPDRPLMDEKLLSRVVDSVRGLPLGAAENIIAMNITRNGVDAEGVWEAKRRQVEQQKGISIWRGGERFDDICGLANLKEFGHMVIEGREPPKGIVFIDEIEKLLAGSGGGSSGGDSSGVSQGFLQQLLTYMQDYKVRGIILIGPPGTGKSLIAKAMGNEAGIPTIAFDLNGMKGSLVGESEQALRQNLKVVTSVTGGKSFWVATCNSISSLPPELRRRFKRGTFFVDLPDEDERKALWSHYIAKYELDPDQELPDDSNWSGAEIESCCDAAWEFNKSLLEVQKFVVPIYVQARETIEGLRKSCDGRYLSASYPGLYRVAKEKKSRKVDLN